MEHIRHGFGERIPEDVSLQLVMSCGNKLVTPNIQEGQELNGMLIHKIFKTKALYLRPSRTLLADSEEEKYLSTAAGSTDKDSDEDHCVIPAVTRSCVTTRAALRNTDPYPSSNNGEGIPGTGSDDADTNDPATSGRKRRRESQGVDGSPGASSQTTGWLARDGNPGTSGYDYSSYLNLVSTLSQESSDDEEFNKAIIASMECQIAEKVPTKEILLELSSKINSNRQCKFNINRSAVWEGATRGFQRLSYDPTSIIYVKFSDDMGRQEEGIDLGGPRREYLRLLMETVARSPMFEGKENCKSLALDSTALREDRYYLAGRAIAVSLVHGGPPPNFLSPTIFSLLVKGSANPALEEIADPELLNKVRKVSESTTAEELEESKAPLLDYLANAGCLRPVHSDSDRELLVKDIVMFQVVHRVQGPFQRFCEGMKTLGVLDAVRKHPDSFKPLFCYEEHLLSADQMDNLFIIQLSPEGSNKRTAEERVVTYWRDYLQDAEGNYQLIQQKKKGQPKYRKYWPSQQEHLWCHPSAFPQHLRSNSFTMERMTLPQPHCFLLPTHVSTASGCHYMCHTESLKTSLTLL